MEISISNRKIGDNKKVFVVAEMSANHQQRFSLAVKTIKAIKAAGADAVKIQTYTPDTITIDSKNKYFKIKQGTLWDGMTLYGLYKKAYTPWDWQPRLKKIAEDIGLVLFSSPFDKSAVDFLEKMDVPAYKVASFEITDIPLIEYIASKGKPVLISTGIAYYQDIKNAVNACHRKGNKSLALLKCTSSYPALPEEMNLNTIPDMINKFGTVVGLSDHGLGICAPLVSVALGARIIEKHFILSRKLGGPDARFSLEPDEFKNMVEEIRNAEKSLGKAGYVLSRQCLKNRAFSRSLFVVRNIKKGEILNEENIRSIRPSNGLEPKYLKDVIGKMANKDLKRGTPLKRVYINS